MYTPTGGCGDAGSNREVYKIDREETILRGWTSTCTHTTRSGDSSFLSSPKFLCH